MSTLKKILIVSKVPSPFIAEMAEEITKIDNKLSCDVWFSSGLGQRGKHWADCLDSAQVMYADQSLNTSKKNITWDELLSDYKYDIIVSLWPLHPKDTYQLKKLKNKYKAKLVFWHEPPIPNGRIRWFIKTLLYKMLSRWLGIDMVWGIGHKATDYWARITKSQSFLIPYYEKINNIESQINQICISEENQKKTRFVFSGQLIERNNVLELLRAVEQLIEEGYSENIEVVLYGSGQLSKKIIDTIEQWPKGVLTLDSDMPNSWTGRLCWLKNADVLITPGIYSGWGLTIPEALSLGKPVISTRGIESAKYFIIDGYNGFLISPESKSIYQAMKLFVNDKQLTQKMHDNCVRSSIKGDVKIGAYQIKNVLTMIS